MPPEPAVRIAALRLASRPLFVFHYAHIGNANCGVLRHTVKDPMPAIFVRKHDIGNYIQPADILPIPRSK